MEKIISEKIDLTKLKYFTDKGEKKYDIDKIINHLQNRQGKGFIRDICLLFGEERRDMLESILKIVGKDPLLNLTEKTMRIQNDGGIYKTINGKVTEEKKTAGGILFTLIKKAGLIEKSDYKLIFKKDYKSRNENRKLMKKIEKLNLI